MVKQGHHVVLVRLASKCHRKEPDQSSITRPWLAACDATTTYATANTIRPQELLVRVVRRVVRWQRNTAAFRAITQQHVPQYQEDPASHCAADGVGPCDRAALRTERPDS